MISSPIDDQKGKPVRPCYGRKLPILIAGTVLLLLAVGAFLLRGPIGLGNGPVDAGVYAGEGNVYSGRGSAGFIIPIHNSGSAPAVIDGIGLIGGTRYPAPRLLRLGVLASGVCGGAWPARQAGRGFVLIGCGGAYTSPLIGRAVGHTQPVSFGFPAAAEVTAPHPDTCWVMTQVVVHYHVGIRHYTATDPYQLAVCTSDDQVNAAMNATEATG